MYFESLSNGTYDTYSYVLVRVYVYTRQCTAGVRLRLCIARSGASIRSTRRSLWCRRSASAASAIRPCCACRWLRRRRRTIWRSLVAPRRRRRCLPSSSRAPSASPASSTTTGAHTCSYTYRLRIFVVGKHEHNSFSDLLRVRLRTYLKHL